MVNRYMSTRSVDFLRSKCPVVATAASAVDQRPPLPRRTWRARHRLSAPRAIVVVDTSSSGFISLSLPTPQVAKRRDANSYALRSPSKPLLRRTHHPSLNIRLHQTRWRREQEPTLARLVRFLRQKSVARAPNDRRINGNLFVSAVARFVVDECRVVGGANQLLFRTGSTRARC